MSTGISVIVKYLKSFAAGLNTIYLMLIICMMGIFIFLNYHYRIEREMIATGNTFITAFTGYYLLYSIPFAAAYFLQRLLLPKNPAFSNRTFLLLLFIAPAFFAFRVSSTFHHSIVNNFWSGDDAIFWSACIGWVLRAAITLLLIYFAWRFIDKGGMPLYGTAALKSPKPYFIMMLCMIPLLAWAATRHDFLQMYPRAKMLYPLALENKTLHFIIFELSYGFDFISIEFFFRGFLILAFIRFFGKDTIIPAACFYCTIHFGKPWPEAVSSFFGGTLLAIVSYHSRSIWGGLIVHLGIAWLMEVAGLIGHSLM